MEIDIDQIKPWLSAALAFGLAFVALTTCKKFIWLRAKRIAVKNNSSWAMDLLADANTAIYMLVTGLAVGIGLEFAPKEFQHANTMQLVLTVIYIIVAAWVIDKLLKAFIGYGKYFSSVSVGSKQLILFAVRILIFALASMVALDTLGISITPILASLGVGSVAVALALQDTLSNFFGGIYVLADRPIRVGDFIQLGDGTEGEVTRIGWRSTHIRKLDNNVVVVPNSQIASTKVTNYNMPDREVAFPVEVGVAYNSDLSHVEKVTLDVARGILKGDFGAVSEFEPILRYCAFADSSINLKVTLRAKTFEDQQFIKHEFIKALHVRYISEKIEIPFPHRVVMQSK